MSDKNAYFDQHSMERDWPPYMDIFTGDTPVKTQLAQMARNSSRLSPALIADMIGRDVTDQYVYARDHTNLLGTKLALTATTGLANLFANNVMKIIGFGASLWVDVAVFGGAAVSLFGSHMNAFGVGAAIFATWLGLSHDKPLSHRILPYLCLGVASAGAALILVSQPMDPKNPAQPNFRKPFTDLLATHWVKGDADEKSSITSLNILIDKNQQKIKEYSDKISKGGVGGKPMTADGSKGNDADAATYQGKIDALEKTNDGLDTDLATSNGQLATATEQDPVDFWGRIFAALYIGTWLFSSQALVAGIIGQARSNHKVNGPIAKKEAERRKHLKDFRHFIEDPNNEKRRNFIRTTVGNVTTQFAGILYAAAPEKGEADKHGKFADLFEETTKDKIHQIAFDYVDRTVEPRRAEAPSVLGGMFNRKSRNADDFAPDGEKMGPQNGGNSSGPRPATP